MKRVRVLHLLTDGSGTHPYFWTLAAHTDRERFELIVGSLGPEGQLQEDMRARGIRTFALGCVGRSGYPRAVLGLARQLRREKVEIVQTHLLDASFVGLLAARLAGSRVGIFTGHHSHEVPLHGKRLRIADGMLSRVLADRIIAPSRHMKEIFKRELGVPDEKIAVIPHGFDLERWTESPAGRDRVRAELGLEARLVFGAAGRLFWIKNYPVLLRAFARVAATHDDTALMIAGEGADRDATEALAVELGVRDRVHFVGHRRDIVDVMSAMDVFVHASRAESFGQVLVEAAALGKPIISTDVGIAGELVVPGETGFLVPSGDDEALGEAMGRSIEQYPLLAARARERRGIEAFAASTMVEGYQDQYESWLRERPS